MGDGRRLIKKKLTVGVKKINQICNLLIFNVEKSRNRYFLTQLLGGIYSWAVSKNQEEAGVVSRMRTHPFKVLRGCLALFEEGELYGCSTQKGLAQFIGCSESLIRSIEKRRVPVSKKLAHRMSLKFGIDPDWLRRKEVPISPPQPRFMSILMGAVESGTIKANDNVSSPGKSESFITSYLRNSLIRDYEILSSGTQAPSIYSGNRSLYEQISEGNLRVALERLSDDEIGDFTRSFECWLKQNWLKSDEST